MDRHPDRPQPAAAGITVAMGGGDANTTTTQWFNRAVAAQCDYPMAYQALFAARLPRWGGSHEAMFALCEAAAATARYDTGIPGQYDTGIVDIYRDAVEMKQDPPALICTQAVYDRFLDFRAHYCALVPNADPSYADSERAVMAWVCGRPKDCLHWMDMPGDTPVESWYQMVEMTSQDLHAAALAASRSP